MSVSKNTNSNSIGIEELSVTPFTPSISNIHHVAFDIDFNANMTSKANDVVVKIKDILSGDEEDISSTLSFSAPSTLSYTFSYNSGNSNIEILTPKIPTDLTIQHQIIVELDGNNIKTQDIEVDSCRKYFENSGDLGVQDPSFELETYDFNSALNFDLYSYIVDSTDTIKFYPNGVPSENGIKETFDTLNDTLTGSTPVITYDIASNISGLTAKTYSLDSSSDILIEIEKPSPFTENNTFSIVNSFSGTQNLEVYMDNNFNEENPVYSSSGATDTIQYTMFVPVWKDILSSESLSPSITFSGDISGAIVGTPISTVISNSNAGEITVSVEYLINDAFLATIGQTPIIGNNEITGSVSINIGGFTIDSGNLTWTSVKSV